MAIAFRAGAVLKDMEFVQFHPTSLFVPGAPHFLLSEAMRGEGALLRNKHGELFMKDYHPLAELAPRDVVSRAIISEMIRTGSNHVYLDLTHLDKEFVRSRFPRINATCRMYRVEIADDLIPVSPAAHYIMGGVKTDLSGATTIPRLYAAGEVACTGVHGANRLASNSLLEGLVFGARAGKAASQQRMTPWKNREKRENDVPMTSSERRQSDPDLKGVRDSLRNLMWEKVGIIRCAESLSLAGEHLSRWLPLVEKTSLQRQEQELKNMVIVSHLITEAAIARKGSIGAHFRSDFPMPDEDWSRHTLSHRDTVLQRG
jgi:L-aspartate oxidase